MGWRRDWLIGDCWIGNLTVFSSQNVADLLVTRFSIDLSTCDLLSCLHPILWIPAFAGMTISKNFVNKVSSLVQSNGSLSRLSVADFYPG